MYYYYCQICKIPFDIARIRRPDEPPRAAWGSYGQRFVYWESNHDCHDCSSGGALVGVGRDLEVADEHIAGPNCKCLRGYSGYRISASEMKGIISAQCLSIKHPGWTPEPDDEDFEREADLCFVTGIGGEGPTEISVGGLEPVKHGIHGTLVNNDPLRPGSPPSRQEALPMHPRCFDLFKKQSRKLLGRVDIDKLWRWRNESPAFDHMDQGDTDLVIVMSEGNWYRCERGTEYLVADPLHIPRLERLISSCAVTSGTQSSLVFPFRASNKEHDIFGTLPAELCLMIIDLLGKQDVANVRLVSRNFSQVPQSFFQELVLSEMPWVWEVETVPLRNLDWHKLWSRLARADGGICLDSKERARDYFRGEEISIRLAQEIPTIEARLKAVGIRAPRSDEEIKGLRNRRRLDPILEDILRTPDGS